MANNVVWAEPNHYNAQYNKIMNYDEFSGTYVDTNQRRLVEIAPDLSDFCISVDLEVEVHNRVTNATSNQGNKVIIIKFSSGNDSDNYSVSFLSGTKCKYGDKEINYLTTSPYDCSTMDDILNNGSTKEMFGIKSIDIEYNNYMVPVVTINFTDIRGVSLFAPEELRHESSYNGIDGYSNADIAGSFFKCFFTFPYPKFSLMVKGFYGNPVTYELTCSDFKASFDSSTGNFNAVAKFIGYSFALINDVTINALVAAPLSEYKGADYWKNRRFMFEDGSNTLIPKLDEVLINYKEIQESIPRLQRDNDLTQKQNELSDKLDKLNQLRINFDNYFNAVNNSLVKKESDQSNKVIACLIRDKKEINDYNTNVSNLLNLYKACCDDIYNSYGIQLHDIRDVKLIEYDSNNSSRIVEKLIGNVINNLSDGTYYVFDGQDANQKINDLISEVTQDKEDVDKKVSESIKANISTILGFKPTVQNMTHILLAHLETLLYCMYEASEEAKGRTLDSIDLPYTDINSTTNNSVGLFPQVGVLSSDGDKVEKSWIGDINGAENEPEVKLIHGLLNGIDKFNKISDEVVEATNEYKSSKNICVDIPVTFTDLFSNENPFVCNIDYSDLSDFVGRLFLRIANVIGSHYYYDRDIRNQDLLAEMGRADAYNFYSKHHNANKLFMNVLNSGALNSGEKIINFALSKGEPNKPNAWNTNNDDKTPLLTSLNQNKYLDIQFINTSNGKILPIIGGSWDGIHHVVQSQSDNGSSLTNKSLETYDKSYNEFHIDLNYQKYLDLTIDESYKELKSLFNVEYNADLLYETFYAKNDINCFVKKFEKLPSDVKIMNSLEYSLEYSDLWDDDIEVDKKVIVYKDESNKKRKLNRKKRSVGIFHKNPLKACLQDTSLISDYTIDQFPGYKNGKIDDSITLFSQEEYYTLDNYLSQAYVFLNLFDVDCNIKLYGENKIELIPYIVILKIGAYFWKLNNDVLLTGNFKDIKDINVSNLGNLRNDVKNTFIDVFTQWARKEFINNIHNPFSVSNGNYQLLIDEIERISKLKTKGYYTSVSNEYYAYLSCVDKEHYRSVAINGKLDEVRFFNNENSSSVNYVTKLLLTPCVTIMGINDLTINTQDNTKKIFIFKRDNAIVYIDSFLNELNRLYKPLRDNVEITNEFDPCNVDKNIKIALYNYLKILWDRWLSGTEQWEHVWSFDAFKSKWHFIDSFYNKIGDVASVNIHNFVNDIILCQQQKGYSLLTFLTTVYSKDRFNLFCVQNFISMFNDKKMKEMFKPLPHNMITSEMLERTSDFVVLYTYEYSSKLDIGNGPYVSDSFDINGSEEQMPIELLNNRSSNDYRVPAFQVTYGKQYQSYFKDINVSMEAPIASEQALLAKFQIASMHSASSGENGKKLVPIGADLYTIYANNSYTCTVKMMGCAWVQPLMYFQLNNVPMFRGSYLIQKVSHHIEPGNMETTFVGTRMSRYSNRLINNNWFLKENIENGGLNNSIKINYENENASIYNDCDYKFFNPLNGGSEIGISSDDLDLSIAVYGRKYGGWKIDNISNTSRTIAKFLGDIAFGEAGNQDELGVKLVLTVIYNRCAKYGNLVNVLRNNKQHEISKQTTDPRYEQWAREIFTQTPAILRGEQTKISKEVPIWSNGVNTGKMTSTKSVTLEDLQMIDGYCTTDGYNSNNTADRKNLEPYPPQWWHNVKYCLHHEGHVFVSESKSKHWEGTTNVKASLSNEEFIIGLFNAIKNTADHSKRIHISGLTYQTISNFDGIFEITTSTQLGNANIFDIVLNTYMSYVKELIWVSNNSTENLPDKIIIIINKDYSVDKRVFASLKNNELYPIQFDVNNEMGNEHFNIALKKKYGYDLKLNRFHRECKNFSSIINKNKNWETIINNIIYRTNVSNCSSGINNGFDKEGRTMEYSWDSFDNHPANNNEPTKAEGELNVNKMVDYVKSHLKTDKNAENYKKGECAKYVKEAIVNGGGLKVTNNPNSACVYSKHLEAWGFKLMTTGTNKDGNPFKVQNGDIAVSAASKKHKHGHIQIYVADAKKWYSDKAFNSVAGYGDSGIPYQIWRYKA